MDYKTYLALSGLHSHLYYVSKTTDAIEQDGDVNLITDYNIISPVNFGVRPSRYRAFFEWCTGYLFENISRNPVPHPQNPHPEKAKFD